MADVFVKLPCNVGDTVYQATSTVNEYKVSSITIYPNNNILIIADNYEKETSISFGVNCIGKRYFLTKVEAELKAGE